MAGIYIHIPFCKQACSYCDFHFSTNFSRKKELLIALEKEIELRSNYVDKEIIETIYFGGGTPSILSKTELNSLFQKLHQYFEISQDAEVTLEANPDDLTATKLQELSETPVNRLSIGVQSFFEEDLRFMNRAHSAEEAKDSILLAKQFEFNNISIDLIFGGQTTSHEMWQQNLDTFFELDIDHLSAYSLTIEEKTALAHQVKTGKVANVDDEKNYDQYLMLQKAIKKHDFQQYELSNYCKNDSISKHNTSYWLGKKYLGLGPSAHSFNGVSRQWNVRNNIQYINFINADKPFFEKEELSEIDRYHEYLITSLRTKWGIERSQIENHFSEHIVSHFNQKINNLNKSIVDLSNTFLKIKPSFLFQSDEIVRELMVDFEA